MYLKIHNIGLIIAHNALFIYLEKENLSNRKREGFLKTIEGVMNIEGEKPNESKKYFKK